MTGRRAKQPVCCRRGQDPRAAADGCGRQERSRATRGPRGVAERHLARPSCFTRRVAWLVQRARLTISRPAAAGLTSRGQVSISLVETPARPVGAGAGSLPEPADAPPRRRKALDCPRAGHRDAGGDRAGFGADNARCGGPCAAEGRSVVLVAAEPGPAACRRARRRRGLDRLLVPPPSQAGRPRNIDQLRADFDRRVAAIENVRAGRAHPLHFDYLRGARDRLTAEATRLAEQLPLGPAESAKGWLRGYLGRVDEVNRGTARDLPESPRDDPFGPRPDVLGQYREMGRQAASGAVERTAQVCLGVAPGHAVVVTLRRSSGNSRAGSPGDRLVSRRPPMRVQSRPSSGRGWPATSCESAPTGFRRRPASA